MWLSEDKARAAFLAGEGKSGAEAAATVGGTTATKVRAMLRKVGVHMHRRTGGEELIMVRWRRREHAALQRIADELDLDIEDAAAAALRAILADPAPLLRQLQHMREAGP